MRATESKVTSPGLTRGSGRCSRLLALCVETMTRYAAFLRGVSLMNLKMPDLKAGARGAGFTDVMTLLASGNIVFSAGGAWTEAAVERKVEAAVEKQVGKKFGASNT